MPIVVRKRRRFPRPGLGSLGYTPINLSLSQLNAMFPNVGADYIQSLLNQYQSLGGIDAGQLGYLARVQASTMPGNTMNTSDGTNDDAAGAAILQAIQGVTDPSQLPSIVLNAASTAYGQAAAQVAAAASPANFTPVSAAASAPASAPVYPSAANGSVSSELAAASDYQPALAAEPVAATAGTTTIGGYSISTTWLLIGGAGVLLLMVMKGRK
ncbi:MAG: hypothetical protein ACRD3D_13170 [Terriglobia bacterium]